MVFFLSILELICLLTRYRMHSEIRAKRWPSGNYREGFVNKEVFDEKVPRKYEGNRRYVEISAETRYFGSTLVRKKLPVHHGGRP